MSSKIPTTASAVRSSGLPVPKKKLISSTVVPDSDPVVKRSSTTKCTQFSGVNINDKAPRRNGTTASVATRGHLLGKGGVMGGRVGKRTMRKSMSTPAMHTIGKKNVPAASMRAGIAGRAARKPVTTVLPATKRANAAAGKVALGNNNTGGQPAAKKRAAWDLKGRLQDMESQFDKLTNQLQHTQTLKETITTKSSTEISSLSIELRETKADLEHKSTLYNTLRRDHDELVISESSLKRRCQTLDDDLCASQHEVSGLKSSVATLTSTHAGTQAELEASRLLLDQGRSKIRTHEQTIDELRAKLESEIQKNEKLEAKMHDHETERRVLHNTIQELKGNIRVFCRVRPLLGDELIGNDGTVQHMCFPDEDKHSVLELEKLGEVNHNESTVNYMKRGNKFEFNFDRVFEPTSTQGDVFEEISQLVQSALDGYNVCIFAYGQTGSGKTFTMEGPPKITDDTVGMIPRAIQQIFNSAKSLEERGWQYEFEAQFLEIYNETIRDLLAPSGDEKKHEIKLTSAKKGADVIVTNLTSIKVQCYDQVPELLREASHNRAVAETKCNERSSRSHSVFRLKLHGNNTHTQEQCTGLLNLIDLAGSERLKDSESQGVRLKETQNINKSLANLGNVIMALGNKDPHIPYRNSKLTYLLQNCLGGQSKTLMFVNVSPKEECFQETLNSLRFATKVNNCHIGTAQKKTK